MGTDKAMVEFCGKPMIEHVATALVAAGLEMLVVGRAQAPGDLPAIVDIADLGGGPAVGLLTAFRHLPDSDVLLIAVDQPQVRSATVVEILHSHGIGLLWALRSASEQRSGAGQGGEANQGCS